MSVGRICSREVHLIEAGETVLAAAQRMRERNVGTLLVLDESERPIGIVTDRDLAVRVLAAGGAPTTPVGDVMTTPVRVVAEETPIEDALVSMRSGKFRRLPVVGRRGKLIGVVTLDDVLALLADELAQIGRIAEPA